MNDPVNDKLELHTSNSWRRFHFQHGGPACEPTTQRDGHLDLHFPGGPDGPVARRFLATWNACVGVSTEVLEKCAPEGIAALAVKINTEPLIADLRALVTDCENKWSDPHTLRHARETLDKFPEPKA